MIDVMELRETLENIWDFAKKVFADASSLAVCSTVTSVALYALECECWPVFAGFSIGIFPTRLVVSVLQAKGISLPDLLKKSCYWIRKQHPYLVPLVAVAVVILGLFCPWIAAGCAVGVGVFTAIVISIEDVERIQQRRKKDFIPHAM